MIEIVLLGVIVVLSGLLGWQDYSNRKERKSLINALLAKDTHELVELELADKTKIKEKPTKKEEELIEMSNISDKEYEKLINAE